MNIKYPARIAKYLDQRTREQKLTDKITCVRIVIDVNIDLATDPDLKQWAMRRRNRISKIENPHKKLKQLNRFYSSKKWR